MELQRRGGFSIDICTFMNAVFRPFMDFLAGQQLQELGFTIPCPTVRFLLWKVVEEFQGLDTDSDFFSLFYITLRLISKQEKNPSN